MLLCPFLAFTSTSARADSVTYTFTGTGDFAGSAFTYVNPDGFLSFPTGYLTPTTATDMFSNGYDLGLIRSVNFFNPSLYVIFFPNGSSADGASYNLNTFGAQRLGMGILDIEPTAVTPEPSSVLLLATGALGLVAPLRRRFVRA